MSVKILHVIQRYHPAVGGSETWCKEICGYLSENSFDITVLTLKAYYEEECWGVFNRNGFSPGLKKRGFDNNIRIIRCGIRRFDRFISKIFAPIGKIFNFYAYGPHSIELYLRMIKYVRAGDIVHFHSMPYTYNFIGFFVTRLFGKKAVITPHFHIGDSQFEKKSAFWLLDKFDKVIAVTEYEKDYLTKRGITRDRITVIPNAICPEKYSIDLPNNYRPAIFKRYNIPHDAKIIVFIGRKMEYKGISILIDAIALIRKKIPVKLFLIGPGTSWFDNYYASISANIKEDIVDFGVASHETKVRLLRLSDILVLPSRFEAFGIVLLEAWACGLPVLASDIGPLRSVIKDAGMVFKYGDAYDLRKKALLLLEDSRLSAEMAKKGLQSIFQNYLSQKTGRAAADIYISLAKTRRNNIL
jgi:glycosyltransferase involved in cell wall biosynthesis